MTIATVHSSWGDIRIDATTGTVLEFNLIDDPESTTYMQITKFDLAEYRLAYPTEQHPVVSYDILDLGYWYGHNHAYEPPDLVWRKDCAYERANCISIAVPSSVADLFNPATPNTGA
jgi:hypothetical protein